MILLRWSLCYGWFILPLFSLAQHPARISEESRQILTYGFSDPNPVAINSKTAKIYPYFLFEGYSKEGTMQSWKVIKLENDYVEIYVLPEVGGKIWGAIEKSTGKEFVYRNEVMKFRNIAMRGPWTSGGIEFNFGLIGHHPSTATPVDYTVRTNEDGSVSCFVGNLDLPSRTNWRVEIRLPRDKAYVETHAMWSNPTTLNQSYYNWMTAAAVVSDDLEFYYPGKIALSHGGAPSPWPVDAEGHNMAMYKENAFGSHKSLHTVGVYKNFMGGYYHNSKFGFGHWALYDEMPGHKLWLWALSRNGAIWEDLLTDSDGQYLEYQAGRTFNQYDPPTKIKTSITQPSFSPHTTDRWTEIWFPFKDIGGIKEVSPYGVLNAANENGKLSIGINALAAVDATVEVSSRGKILFTEQKKFKPMDVFTTAIPLDSDEPYTISVSGMNLSLQSDEDKSLKRPFTEKIRPTQLTNEALFNEALEQKEYREYVTAKQMFLKCLSKDSLHLGALTNLAELCYRSAKFDSALWYANRVLRQDAYDPGANYVAGITYKAQEDFINALEALGWAARAPAYRSAAYAEMASVRLQQGNLALAEHYARLSLDNNRYNFTALHLLAVIARKMNNAARASELSTMNADLDPLDHFAQYEKYLLTKSSADLAKFSSTITNEFPYQSYLEIALEYFSYGLRSEALDVLDHAPDHPEVLIWKAYLNGKAADLAPVANASPAFVFPYRLETLLTLEWAVVQNSNWKFKYYLALNLQAVQQTEAASKIFSTLKQLPDYAPFYQTRARLLNDSTTLADLERANQLAPGQWRTWHDLIAYHEGKNHNPEALALSAKATKLFKDDYTIRFQYAKALLNAGKFRESITVLKAIDILPFEGSGEGQVVYEQAMLSQAIVLLEKNKYDEALSLIRLSREWPENLGVGKPYDPDERIQDYLEAFILRHTGKTAEAKTMRQKVADYAKSKVDGKPLNNIFTYLVLKEDGQKEAANRYLTEMKSMSERSSPIQWVILTAEHGDGVKIQETETDRYKNIILKVTNLAGKH
jgi:predicted Zn-dependent protease